jgi:hypothetical protein
MKADWDLVEAAFKVHWPKEVLVAETTKKRRRKLRSEKLLKVDIGVTVMANGVEMSGQARWAGKIQTLAAQADDPSGALIHSVWNEMPQLMKKLVKSTYPTWPEFTQAIKDVSKEDIETAIVEEGRIIVLKRDAKALRAQITQQSPTAPLRAGFSGFNIDCESSPVGVAAPDVNIFQGGVMGSNNIMRAFQLPPEDGEASCAGDRPSTMRTIHVMPISAPIRSTCCTIPTPHKALLLMHYRLLPGRPPTLQNTAGVMNFPRTLFLPAQTPLENGSALNVVIATAKQANTLGHLWTLVKPIIGVSRITSSVTAVLRLMRFCRLMFTL